MAFQTFQETNIARYTVDARPMLVHLAHSVWQLFFKILSKSFFSFSCECQGLNLKLYTNHTVHHVNDDTAAING